MSLKSAGSISLDSAFKGLKGFKQGVTKRYSLSYLTNSALVYEPKCGGRGELRGLSQCCGSETFISDPVSDPDPAFSEFLIRIRFRIRIRIRIRILDSNPDPDPGFKSGSQTGKNFFF
jgi:hypothetical protein